MYIYFRVLLERERVCEREREGGERERDREREAKITSGLARSARIQIYMPTGNKPVPREAASNVMSLLKWLIVSLTKGLFFNTAPYSELRKSYFQLELDQKQAWSGNVVQPKTVILF